MSLTSYLTAPLRDHKLVPDERLELSQTLIRSQVLYPIELIGHKLVADEGVAPSHQEYEPRVSTTPIRHIGTCARNRTQFKGFGGLLIALTHTHKLVTPPRFELRLIESKSIVLPLHYEAINWCGHSVTLRILKGGSLACIYQHFVRINWSTRRDSNSRRTRWQRAILPLNYWCGNGGPGRD